MLGISDRLARGKSTIGRVLVAFMVAGFVALLAAGIAAAWVTSRIQQHTEWVNHTYEMENAISRTQVLIEQTETARRGYLLTGSPTYLESYRDFGRQLPLVLKDLARSTADNPRQQASVRRLRALFDELAAVRNRTTNLVTDGLKTEAVALFAAEDNPKRMLAVRRLLTSMLREERALLAIRDVEQQMAVRTFYGVLAAAGALLVFVAIASLLTVLRFTRDLSASRDELRALNETLEDQVEERTADLSRANEEIQRFAYIVSHDLRSPLVNVMGFTAELSSATKPLGELVDRVEEHAPDLLTPEMKLAAREDLPEAIGFIRTSTQKMDRLINAILKLSREGRRVIAPEKLDLAVIVDNAVGAIRHVIDERGATVTVHRPMPPIVSDRLAVEQILSNLIENATKYLQPGRPGQISVSASKVRERVVIAVADNGRGIDPRDHQRIFDLFRRSGAQDQPGEGIGLAHVRALAYRLGGTIDVASRLGEGATFRLSLPATLQTSQEPKE